MRRRNTPSSESGGRKESGRYSKVLVGKQKVIDLKGELVKLILLVFACHSSMTLILSTPTGFFVQLQQVFGSSSVNGSLDKKPCQQRLSSILQGVGAGIQIGLTLKIREFPKYKNHYF